MKHDDEDLVQRVVAGERSAQRELFAREQRRVHATLYRIVGSNREIEDLAQDAFVRIFRSLGSWRAECSLSTWIDRVATRAALDHLRRREVPMLRLDVVVPAPSAGADPVAALEHREVARSLYAILDRLDPKYRIAFALHVIDGRPLAEVAAVTETSLVATKVRVWRARRQVIARARADARLAEWLQRRSP